MKSTSSTILRALKCVRSSSKLSSASVAPWPISRSSLDGWLAGELDTLRLNKNESEPSSVATWFMHAMDVAISSQSFAIKSFSNSYSEDEKKGIENHLKDVVDLLDACNYLREKIESLRNYIGLVNTVVHWLDGNSHPNNTVLERVRDLLNSCEGSEKKFAELEKCSSNLTKLVTKGLPSGLKTGSGDSELDEILSGSKAITVLAIGAVGIMLSFKSRRSLPVTKSSETSLWSNSLNELRKEMKEGIEKRRKSGGVVLDELRNAVTASKNLRGLLNSSHRLGSEDGKRELRVNVEDLRRNCFEIEEGIITPLDGKVDDLYRNLISVRLNLLDIMSK